VKIRSLWIPQLVIICIWVFTVVMSSVEAGLHHTPSDMYFTPATNWCWIGGAFSAQRIAGEYVWLWIAALASIVLYIPLFFIMKGTVDIDTSGRRLRIRRKEGVASHLAGDAQYKVLLYPVAYTILVLPLSIVRWINFQTDVNIPFSALFAVSTIFQLTGLVNVILFLGFRGSVTLLSSSEDDGSPSESMEMSGKGEVRGRGKLDGGLRTGVQVNDTRTIEPLSVADSGLPD